MQTVSYQTSRRFFAILTGLALAGATLAAPTNRFVAMPGIGGHQSPYTNWAMAATSINAAVTLANTYNEGDTVWIAAGHYVLTQTVSVGNTQARGFTGNPDDVLVDGDAKYGCFRLTNAGSFLGELTITNGYTQDGAGIYSVGTAAGAIVSNCIIINCTASRYAGGIIGNIIGLHSRIERNVAGTGAGGVRFVSGYLRDCTISQNTGSDGGINLSSSDQQLINCVITGNVASGSGGGIRISAPGNPVVSNCLIINNSATVSGGGVMFYRLTASAKFYNCLIADNTAVGTVVNGAGGGIHWSHNTSGMPFGEYHNCTIAGNSSVAGIGGIETRATTPVFSMFNTIIYSNRTGNYNIDTAYMSNCCSTGLVGNSNITNYPEFVDPANGNYRLQDGSQCLNAGTNIEGMAEAFDLDGRPRLDRFSRKVDMGAYEFVPEGMLFMSK